MRNGMLSLLIFVIAAASGWADEAVATIEYSEGAMRLARGGNPVAKPGIGDDVFDGDLISTGPGSTVTLRLEKATGMSGTLKLAPKSSFYFNIDSIKGERRSEAELISGQIGLKLKRIGGAPSFNVTTDSAVCAVRGTEFDVLASPGGAILVACAEGEVAVTSEGQASSAVPGQAVEKREGAKLARRALAASDYEAFKRKWIEDESAAFARDAPKAARRIAARYLDLAERLSSLHERIAASGAVKAWIEEERKGGAAISDAELDRRLAEAAPLIAESRGILGSMERIAARVSELRDAVGDDAAVLSQLIGPGRTVGDFFKRFEVAKEKDLQRIAALRKAAKLLKLAQSERERRRGGARTAPRVAPRAAKP